VEGWSQAEEKLIEKLREMLDKHLRAGQSLSRRFSLPSRDDSDEIVVIDLNVMVVSATQPMTEAEVAYERRRLRDRLPE